MEQPSPKLNGVNFTPTHDPIDEFDIASTLLQPGEVLPTKKDIYEPYGENRVKVTEAGIDGRGLPLINFLGELRPHYSAMDVEMSDTLKIEMISKLRTYRRLYPELGILEDTDLMKLSLNALHTYVREIDKQISGIKYGIMYEKAILTTCVVLESILGSLGLEMVKGFTENNIKAIPIFRMVAANIASTQGGGVVETLPVSYQIGGLVTIMILLYGGTNYIGGQKGGALYQVISDVASKQLLSGVAPTPQMQPYIPSAQGGLQQAAAPATSGLDSIMSGFSSLAPLLSAFTSKGNDAEKKDKKPKRKPSRYRQ